ncbi:MAG: response regulator [Promethearchaeota archaeon]
MSFAKILIVEDDKDIVNLFVSFLKMEGHEIIGKAYNGEQALELYNSFQNPPDIILMDHRMPMKNGLETTKEILAINPHCKIIFISADYSVRNKALEIGAIDFLEKPIKFNKLVKIIENALIISH